MIGRCSFAIASQRGARFCGGQRRSGLSSGKQHRVAQRQDRQQYRGCRPGRSGPGGPPLILVIMNSLTGPFYAALRGDGEVMRARSSPGRQCSSLLRLYIVLHPGHANGPTSTGFRPLCRPWAGFYRRLAANSPDKSQFLRSLAPVAMIAAAGGALAVLQQKDPKDTKRTGPSNRHRKSGRAASARRRPRG